MRFQALALVLTLAACNTPQEIPIGMLPPEDDCGAASLQDLVGQNAGALAAMTFDAAATRFFTTGDALTMDFSPSRLNVESGLDGTILRVFCG